MAKTPTTNVVTRKHLARLEKERIQRRYILTASIAVFAIVLGLILFGVLDQNVLQRNRPVARVGSDVITIGEFQTQVRYTRYRLIEQLNYFANDPIMVQFFGSYIQQIATQLNSTTQLGQQVLDRMIEDRIIAMEAEKLGITVSEAELDEAVEQFFGYYAQGTLTPSVTPTTFNTATLSPTQLALVPPTATPTEFVLIPETPAPTDTASTPTPDVTATPAGEMTATPDYTPTPLPTPTEFTREGFEGLYDTYVTNLADIRFTRADLRNLVKAELLREKVLPEITKDEPAEAEQVWARHILVATQEEAQAVRDRLAAGEDFAALASELSTDTSNKDNGGDLGWFTREKMVTPFSDAAFAMQVGEISQPVETSFGFHIIQVIGHEVRPLTADEMAQAKENTFFDWVDAKRAELQVETYDRWIQAVPTTPAIPAELQQIISAVSSGQTLP